MLTHVQKDLPIGLESILGRGSAACDAESEGHCVAHACSTYKINETILCSATFGSNRGRKHVCVA